MNVDSVTLCFVSFLYVLFYTCSEKPFLPFTDPLSTTSLKCIAKVAQSELSKNCPLFNF